MVRRGPWLTDPLRVHVDAAARDMATTVAADVVTARLRDGAPQGNDIAEAAASVRRLRPLAQIVMDAMLAQAMARHAGDALGDHLTLFADQQAPDQPGRTA